MSKGKISRIDIITIIIAFAALLTSVISIYFQFFNHYSNLSAKFTGVNTHIQKIDNQINSELSFLFLNTGKNEIAFISGFIYFSFDETIPKFHFAGNREHLNEKQKKWYTESIDTNFIIESGRIKSEKFNIKIPFDDAKTYFKQNLDLLSNEKIDLYFGTSLNFIDSEGKLKTSNFKPTKIKLRYLQKDGDLQFTGAGSSVNLKEMKYIKGKYKIY